MKSLLELILKNIVTDPKSLKVEEIERDGEVIFELEMLDEDKGLIIGSKGRNIKSIRNILSVIAKRENKRVNINIKD